MIRLLKPDGTRKSFLVHRLVATAFIPNPDNLPEVNHKDKNTQNPNMNNLEWCTRKANLLDSYKTMGPARNSNKYLFNRLQYDENNKVRELRVS